MRKLLFILGFAALLLSTGCEKVHPEAEGGMIQFSPKLWNSDFESKATPVTGNTLPASSYCGVLGYISHTGVWVGDETPQYIYNTKLNSNGSYANDADMKYWPKAPKKTSFFAYYPYCEQSGNPTIKLSSKTAQGHPVISFTTQENIANQVDFMTAAATLLDENDAPVPLSFSHILTKIGVFCSLSGSNPGGTYTIKSIKLKNVCQKATFAYDSDWENHNTPIDFIVRNTDMVLNGTPTNAASDGQYLLLIPQNLTNITLEVVIETSIQGNTTQYTKTVSLATTQTWSKGKGININISYTPTLDGEMTVTFNVVRWESVNITTTIS